MRVELIDKLDDFLKLKEFWNDLLRKSNSNFPFLTFEWLLSWWKSFGEDKQLFVLIVNETIDESSRGIAPLMLVKSAGFRIIEFIGTGLSDYLDFIIEGLTVETINAFFEYLNKKKKSWDLIFLSDVLLEDGSVERLLKAGQSAGWKTCFRRYTASPYLSINGDWSQFLSSKSSNFRYTLKRKEKRLEKEGLNLKICRFNSNNFENQTFEDIVEIERNSWKFKAGTAKTEEESLKKFYIDFLSEFANNGWLNLWVGYLNDDRAAYLINFDYREKIWFYNAAYHYQSRRYAIGSILTHHAVRDAFSRGKTEYDFMRGEEEYKDRWASGKHELFQLVFYKKSLRSILGCFLLFRLRWFLAKYRKIKEIRLYLKKFSHKLKTRLS